MLNTSDIQQAFVAESEKAAAKEKAAIDTAPIVPVPGTVPGAAAAAAPAPAPTPEPAAQTPEQAAAEMESIRKYFHSKGIEMSPEEIIAKVKEKPAPQPAAEITVDDTEVENYFSTLNKKEKYEVYKAAKDKTDMELVIDFKKAKIKEKAPHMTDDQVAAFIKRSYFQDEDGFYEGDEKLYAQAALAEEAAAIRAMISDTVEGARQNIKNGKVLTSQSQQFAAQVESLVNGKDKLSFSLGVSGQKELGNWDLPLHDETRVKVKNAVSSPESFAKYVSDPVTGQLDLKKVVDMVMAYELQPVIAKSIAAEYHSRGLTEGEALLGDGIQLRGNQGGEKKTDAEEHNEKQVGSVIGKRYR